MGEHGYDDLARDLAALGRAVDVPVPGASLAVSVLERLPQAPPAKAVAGARRRRIATLGGSDGGK